MKKIEITVDKKKIKYRNINPVNIVIFILCVWLFVIYIILLNEQHDVSSLFSVFVNSITVIGVIFTIWFPYTQLTSDQMANRFIRLTNISKRVAIVKNEGTMNVSGARITNVRINNRNVELPCHIHFLAVNEEAAIAFPFKHDSAKEIELEYDTQMFNCNKMLVTNFRQIMLCNEAGKFAIKSNTCKIEKQIYYRWIL